MWLMVCNNVQGNAINEGRELIRKKKDKEQWLEAEENF